jgi:hypothetical protein
MQRKAGSPGPARPSSLAGADVTTGGLGLPFAMRRSLEPLFGVSFGDVRLHDDPRSHALAHDVSARAFTVGQDIHFGAGQFRPDSRDGLRLLAHELTHLGLDHPSGGIMTPCGNRTNRRVTKRMVDTINP